MSDQSDERARVAALQGYGMLDTPNEVEFDAIVREAAMVLGTPIALISLLNENRQWFKAKIGLEARETPQSISFCTHAIRGPNVFVVEDATKDERFSNNPLVTSDPSIRFYAGAPLKTSTGMRIGTLCVMDSKPHPALTTSETLQLSALADRTMAAMEKRKRKRSVAAR